MDLEGKIAEMIHSQFGLKPKEQPYMYRHPYLEYFDSVPLPNRYPVLDLYKFSRQDNVSTIEHIIDSRPSAGK